MVLDEERESPSVSAAEAQSLRDPLCLPRAERAVSAHVRPLVSRQGLRLPNIVKQYGQFDDRIVDERVRHLQCGQRVLVHVALRVIGLRLRNALSRVELGNHVIEEAQLVQQLDAVARPRRRQSPQQCVADPLSGDRIELRSVV
ncbi:MAG: hypothetical protein NTV92_08590, partial [Candidatus Bipolaricaulota bacterium]|nr:hypothetical protein [Candidatus Bipolaricaulota bacterium]